LPPPDNSGVGGLANKLKNYGATPGLIDMVVKGKGQPDFNKYADPKAEASVDRFGFGGNFGAFKDSAIGLGHAARKTFESERFGDIGAGMFDMAGKAASMVPGGEYAAPVFKFGEALMESIEVVRKWADGLHQANMTFAEFSTSMAHVEAESEARRIRLSQERGERRAPSARRLAEARDKLDSKLAVWEDKWASFKAELMTPLLEGMALAAESTKSIYDLLYGQQKEEVKQDALTDIIDEGTAFDKYGRPSRFPRLPGDPR
jgi:hypothetical protein